MICLGLTFSKLNPFATPEVLAFMRQPGLTPAAGLLHRSLTLPGSSAEPGQVHGRDQPPAVPMTG